MVKIKVSPFGGPQPNGEPHPRFVEAQYDWPEDCFLQAGAKGVVLSMNPNKPSYTTAFVEAFPEGTFIRGEGATIAEAETAAWVKYETYSKCPGHEWEARGYKNGAGFCKHCNKFASKVFSGEQLGQFCVECSQGTTYGTVEVKKSEDSGFVAEWACEEHIRPLQQIYFNYLSSKDTLTTEDGFRFRQLEFLLRKDDEEIDGEKMGEAIDDILRGLGGAK